MKLHEFLLTEVAHIGMGRVPRNLVASMIEYVAKISGIHKHDLHPSGSTGKAADTGDIDLVVDSSKYDPDHAYHRMIEKFGKENCKYFPGIKTYTFAIPLVKKVEANEFAEVGGKVQVDLLFSPKVEWAKFSHHSEGHEGMQTSYKGAIRTILLKAVASVIEERGTDAFVFHPESKQLIIRVGRTFDLTTGLRRIFQVRPMRQDGTGYLSAMQTVKSLDQLKPILSDLKRKHPGKFDHIHLDIPDHEIVINDPAKALSVMFPGNPVSVDETKTAEGVLDLIQDRFPPAKQLRIFEKAKQYLKQVHGKMRLPEIDKFIQDAKQKME